MRYPTSARQTRKTFGFSGHLRSSPYTIAHFGKNRNFHFDAAPGHGILSGTESKGAKKHDRHDNALDRGKRIVEYKGIVFGEVISGVNFIKDFAAGLSNFFGGRSGSYEEELDRGARERRARDGAARAGDRCERRRRVDIDYEVLGANNGMLMVTASGTAVVCQ